jgi:hypothetical protein
MKLYWLPAMQVMYKIVLVFVGYATNLWKIAYCATDWLLKISWSAFFYMMPRRDIASWNRPHKKMSSVFVSIYHGIFGKGPKLSGHFGRF